MKINIYGPDLSMEALAEMIKHIPPDAVEVIIKCPLRKSVAERACQHPNRLTYDASCDNKIFIHLIQDGPTGKFEILVN